MMMMMMGMKIKLMVALFHLDSTGRDDLARIVQGCLLSLPHEVCWSGSNKEVWWSLDHTRSHKTVWAVPFSIELWRLNSTAVAPWQ